MKKNRFGLILISILMMAAGVTVMYSCTGDETPTTTLAPDDPADGSTTTEPTDDITTTEPTNNGTTTEPAGTGDDAEGCGSSGCDSAMGVSVAWLLIAIAAAFVCRKKE